MISPLARETVGEDNGVELRGAEARLVLVALAVIIPHRRPSTFAELSGDSRDVGKIALGANAV
jgi:hypothetical protein